MIKKLFLAALALLAPVAAHAFVPVRQVQISTNSLTQQSGSFNVQSGTMSFIYASTGTFYSTLKATGSVTLGGAGNAVQISSNVIMPGTTIYSGGTYSLVTDSMSVSQINHQLMRYRKPVAQWGGNTQINLETGNSGTSGASTVVFPDGAVYTETQSGLLNAVINSTASWGNYQTAGIRPSEKPSNQTWYTAYVVKSTGTTASLAANTTDFVVVLSSWQPIQANFSNLNTFFSSNAWVPIATFAYGNGKDITNIFSKFVQGGNQITMQNILNGNADTVMRGLMLATSASSAGLTWTYASGNLLSSGQVPANLSIGTYCLAAAGSTRMFSNDAGGNYHISNISGLTSGQQTWIVPNQPLAAGISNSPSSAQAVDTSLCGYIDNSLGVGGNPQL